MMRLAVLMLATTLLAGCAAGSLASGTPPTSEGPTVSLPPPSFPTAKSPSPLDPVEIVGVVEEGVENGCTMLRTGDELYQLVGSADPLIRPGASLTVRGQPRPELMTTCQQGVPFQVIEVRAT